MPDFTVRDVNTFEPLKLGDHGYDLADAVSVAVEVTHKVKDWEGHSIPEPKPGDIVKVWDIDTHRNSAYTNCLIMGYQDMLEELKLIFEEKLDYLDEEELKEGLNIKVRLVEMSYRDYVGCEID